jgi:hypothetical protein
MNKNLQHSNARAKTFNLSKKEPSTSLKAKTRTFNLQEQKQKLVSISA